MNVSPDAVSGFFLSDAEVCVVGVHDQVLVGVMSRLVVGNNPAGDSQQAQHWNQTQRAETRLHAPALIRHFIFMHEDPPKRRHNTDSGHVWLEFRAAVHVNWTSCDLSRYDGGGVNKRYLEVI